jgi:hypothetical protein
MSKMLKKYIVLFSILLFVFSLAKLPIGCAEEFPSQEKILTLLVDVAKLDIEKYNLIKLNPIVNHPEELGSLEDISGVWNLQSESSKISVQFRIINDSVTWLLIDPVEGPPQYTQTLPLSNSDAAKSFLQNYQTTNSDSSLNSMSQMIDMINTIENSTIEVNNVKLELSITSSRTRFVWKNSFNGAVFSSLSVSFKNSTFYAFTDDRSYIQIGSTEVNISENDAVASALKQASSFSWSYNGESISNFTIQTGNLYAQLLTKARYAERPLELYPYWMVTLPLNGYYPGFVTMIIVEFWADTGELNRIYPLGTGGGPAPTDSPAPSATLQPSQSPAPSSSPAASASPAPNESATPAASQSTMPTVEPSSTSQPTASPSLQPADSSDAKPTDYALLVAAAVVAAVVVGLVAVAFVVMRRRG